MKDLSTTFVAKQVERLRAKCQAGPDNCGRIVATLVGEQTPPLTPRQSARLALVASVHFADPCLQCTQAKTSIPGWFLSKITAADELRGALDNLKSAITRRANRPAPVVSCGWCRRHIPEGFPPAAGMDLCPKCAETVTAKPAPATPAKPWADDLAALEAQLRAQSPPLSSADIAWALEREENFWREAHEAPCPECGADAGYPEGTMGGESK